MIIDVYNHIEPPNYVDAIERLVEPQLRGHTTDPLVRDIEHRLQIMERFGDYMQVLTVGGFLNYAYGDNAVELAKTANDGLAELVSKYPEWFAAGVASLPLEDMDAALVETDRAINDLKLRGVELWAHKEGIPLDSPHYFPLYDKMSQYNLPIWIHPSREPAPDYTREKKSKYRISSTFGWPYDTTVAMTRLVFSGVLEKYPKLKFITHHAGGMVPFFASRIAGASENMGRDSQGLTKPAIEYYRMFYADTALRGGTSALMCACDFFSADHILFGTDMPMGSRLGITNTITAINAVEEMTIPDSDKRKIFEDNARGLLRLNV